MSAPVFDSDYQKARAALANLTGLDQCVATAIAMERERCARAAEWFSNVVKYTAADVAKRIRDPHK